MLLQHDASACYVLGTDMEIGTLLMWDAITTVSAIDVVDILLVTGQDEDRM